MNSWSIQVYGDTWGEMRKVAEEAFEAFFERPAEPATLHYRISAETAVMRDGDSKVCIVRVSYTADVTTDFVPADKWESWATDLKIDQTLEEGI